MTGPHRGARPSRHAEAQRSDRHHFLGLLGAPSLSVSSVSPLSRLAAAILGILSALPVAARLLAAGDPSPEGAVLWARVEVPGSYRFEISEDDRFGRIVARHRVAIEARSGLAAQVHAHGLKPGTRYHYRLVDAAGALQGEQGSFATAPPRSEPRALKLLFGAELGGQGYGRLRPGTGLAVDGWPIFVPMLAERADFFVALGDMLYSDRPVSAEAPDKGFPKGNDWQIPKPGPGYVTDLEDFRRDWLYHRSDVHYDRFLRATPLVAIWDDHEIVNDSGGPELSLGPTKEELARDPRLGQGDPSRPRGEFMPWSTTKSAEGRRKSVFHNPGLYESARRAMFEWNPIPVLADPSQAGGRRLYRSLGWGAHAELIVLDVRSYRDPRYRKDSDDSPKTMLGAAQKRWLKERLETSPATWKIVVSTVPLSLEGGNEKDPEGRDYRDAWSKASPDNPYAYSRELSEIVAFLRQKDIRNVIFLTGDKHFSNLFSYGPDGDGKADFHEANIGPLRSGPGSGKVAVDPTHGPTRLFTDAGKASFSYGSLTIDGETARLTVRIHAVDGAQLPGARLDLDPRPAR